MKQTAKIISTYTADVSGVCSALFELGGMVIMHDASGCNSTYNTHDEPRWYDMDSMVFISALTEIEAIMGDDEKLIGDIVDAANQLHPKFIAIAGTPIPMMIGTDFPAVAQVVEERTGIPAFGFPTNGMHAYTSGAGMALAGLARRMVQERQSAPVAEGVNILGATPLDFSVNGSVEKMRDLLTGAGFQVISTWAMGDDLSALEQAALARVNLVVSASGLPAARVLKERFGIPYVAGVPMGETFTKYLLRELRQSAETGCDRVAYGDETTSEGTADLVIIGEGVYSNSLAAALRLEKGLSARVICPVECDDALLLADNVRATDEEELRPYLSEGKRLVADPLYRPICPSEVDFIALPHEGFSGRMFREDIPNLIGVGFEQWAKNR